MKSLPNNISLQQLDQIISSNPFCKNLIAREFINSYEDFLQVFYDDLDLAINRLESNPQYHMKDSEDQLTDFIVSMLTMKGYDATSGTTNGGNKDVTVKSKNPSWSWIGEAKIYKSITDLREGFLQLSTRYRNINPAKSCAGLLAYTFRQYAADLLKEWKNDLPQMSLRNFSLKDCPKRGPLAFYSVHDHESSGLPFEVRHIGVSLYFKPLDKSGRKAKKYQPKKSN